MDPQSEGRQDGAQPMMSIGELATSVGVTPRTIRWYEERGLLNGHDRTLYAPRRYDGDDYYRMRLIGRARMLGLSIAEIKELVDAHRQDRTERKVIEESIQVLKANLAKLEARISAAAKVRKLLVRELERLEVLLEAKLEEQPGPLADSPRDRH